MAEAAPNYQQQEDFWKPLPSSRLHAVPSAEQGKIRCDGCKAEIMSTAKFCPACGLSLAPQGSAIRLGLRSFPGALEQTLASFIALILGCICLLAAVTTGFLFKITTLSDWQAVQLWRIEWLLAAIALFLAGVLLKRRASRQP